MAGGQQAQGGKLADTVTEVLRRSKIFWSRLGPQQRMFFGAGAAIAVAAVVIAIWLVTSPDYKPLIGGLEPEDLQTVASQLAAKKIPYQIGSDGTSIRVPASQIDAARLEIASHSATRSGRIGFEIFDKVSWGQTEFDEKVNYQRALEGELERTIETIQNVRSARVHIVMAKDSVFTDQERSAKASVTLRLKHGSLTHQEIMQIARLVAASVDNLDPKDVVITDADANRTLAGNGTPDSDNTSLDDELTRRLVATLAPVVGADRIRATVNVEYETGSTEENDEKYDPTVSVPLSMQRTEQTDGGDGVGGVPGTSSNVPSAKAGKPTSPTSTGPSSKTESATYGVNKTVRHLIEPAGGIRRISAAVVVDDAMERQQQNGKWVTVHRKRSPQELKMIAELAQAAVGFNSARGDNVTVENLSFDRPDDSDLEPQTLVYRLHKGVDDFSNLIRYAVLLVLFVLVYFLMIRPFQRKVLGTPITTPALPPMAVAAELGDTSAKDLANLSLGQRSLALKKELAGFIESEPEASTVALRSWLHEEA